VNLNALRDDNGTKRKNGESYRYRKNGYATHTLKALIEEAKRQGLSYIKLSASVSGKTLYQKLGFQKKKSPHIKEMKLCLL
jgi:GNAT superfamily N-acetyltransferase